VTCFFVYRSKALTTKLMTDVLNAVTGWGFGTYDKLILGERIFQPRGLLQHQGGWHL